MDDRKPVPDDIDDRRRFIRGDEPRRENPRQRTLLTGYVIVGGDSNLIQVSVRNLSPEGAQLKLRDGGLIYSNFYLCIPTRSIAVSATVIWRRLPDFGVKFSDEAVPPKLAKLIASLSH